MARNDKRDSGRPSEPAGKSPAPVSPPSSPPTAPPNDSALSGFFRWLLSRTARQANAMCKHVRKLLNHQRDILAPKAIEDIEGALLNVRNTVAAGAAKAEVETQLTELEKTANKWFKPYPNAVFRENVEVLLVALTVAMGVRTFFMQPFKIPTGSMQPTLYGVTSQTLDKDFVIPTGWQRVKEWFHGISYVHLTADQDGEFDVDEIEPPFRVFIFNIYQRVHFAGKAHTIWFPPDFGSLTLQQRAELRGKEFFHKGDDIIKVQLSAGDHLFVDRLTYNFRPPERGDIVVFETHGIVNLGRDQQDTFYIKRLVGLGGETLSLKEDYRAVGVPTQDGLAAVPVGHLVVNGQALSASTPHFENLYSFYGAKTGYAQIPYKENHYYGHALLRGLAPGREFHVGPTNYFVMGDNTMNSSDSRFWGDFPQQKVIGRALFVYWPVTDRFGLGQH